MKCLAGKRKFIVLGAGALVLLVGIVGIAISTAKWKEDGTKTMEHGRFGIVFDAGGTGTRMYVYEYKDEENIAQTLVKKCEEKGLSNYGGKETSLQPLLTSCIKDAEKIVPSDVTATTPVFMKATAGMRKLKLANATEYAKLWEEVRKILNNGSFPVKIADTMTGKEEAINSWTTINEMLGGKDSKGLMEIGSTSIQIAFVPETMQDVPSNMTADIDLNGQKYKIYATSYLCFGKDEFQRRYFAKLVKESSYNKTVYDPCGIKGSDTNFTSDYLWNSPCVKGSFAEEFLGGSIQGNGTAQYTLSGISDYDACKARVSRMFNQTCTQAQNKCGINNVFQPHAYGKYLAIGGAAYYAADFLQLPEHFNRTIFEDKLKELCNSTVEQVKNRPGYGEFSLSYCLSNSFTLYMLENIVKVNMTMPDGFMFADKINGEKVSWTLGYMINVKDQLSPAKYSTSKEISDDTYTILAAIFGVTIFIGFILVILVALARHKIGSQVNM